ncbi:DUF6623 family protein [Clostridium sp. DL1XJH146]
MYFNGFTPRMMEDEQIYRQKLYAFSVHGNSMLIRYSNRLKDIDRTGPFIRVEGKKGSKNTFLFTVPTPLIVNDRRTKLETAVLRFRCGSKDAYINAVTIYDGEKEITSQTGLKASPEEFKTRKFDIPGNVQVKLGITIALDVTFGNKSSSHVMDFSTAGCEYTLI